MQEPLNTTLALLRDPDWRVRCDAVENLGDLSEGAPLELLLTALNDSHLSVRRTALASLGKLGTRTPMDVLMAATHDPDLVHLAIHTLGARMPMDMLLNCLAQSDLMYAVRRTIQEHQLIEQLPMQPLLDLYARDWDGQGEILKLLSMMGNRLPTSFLIQILSEAYDPLHDREMIAQILGSIQDEHVLETVLDTASARYWSTQSIAVQLLGMLKQDVPVAILLKTLSESNRRVSAAATNALENVADQVPYEDLLALLQNTHSWVRVNALKVWENRADVPPLEALIATLKDENEEVRAAATHLCEQRDTGIPLSYLIEAAQDTSANVTAIAVRAVGIWGQSDPERAFAGIVDLVKLMERQPERYSASYEALPEAISSLGSLVSEETLLQAFSEVRGNHQIAQMLGKLGKHAPIDFLIAALDTPSGHLRSSAVAALGLTDSPLPVPALLTVLQNLAEEPYSWSRGTLIEALCVLWKHVPGDVFFSILRDRQLAIIAPDKVLQALGKKKERIPSDLLMQTLQMHVRTSGFGKTALAYLGAFDQLPSIPEAEMFAAMARLTWGYSAQEIKGIRHLLSVPPLLHLLAHPEGDVRHGALTLLQCVPEHVPLEPVTTLLYDADPRIRIAATRCLIDIARPFPAEIFTHILSDPESEVRGQLLESLESVTLDPVTSIDAMIAILADTDVWNRLWALEALSKPGIIERVPVEVLVKAVGTHYAYPDQQTFALEALRDKDPQIAVEHALLALGNSNWFVCQTAFRIVQEFHPTIIPELAQEAATILEGGKPGRFFSMQRMRFFAEMVGCAGHASPQVIARLGELLNWPYWEVRLKAAWALGRLQHDMPASIIRRLRELRHDPHSPAVGETASQALAQLRSIER